MLPNHVFVLTSLFSVRIVEEKQHHLAVGAYFSLQTICSVGGLIVKVLNAGLVVAYCCREPHHWVPDAHSPALLSVLP